MLRIYVNSLSQPHSSLPLNEVSLSCQSSFCPASEWMQGGLVGTTFKCFQFPVLTSSQNNILALNEGGFTL